MTNLDSIIKKKKKETLLYLKGLSSQGYCLSSSHVWMWEMGL